MAKVEGGKISSYTPTYSENKKLHEKPIYQYVLLVLVILSIITSALAFVNTNQLRKTLITGNVVSDAATVSVNEFLKKLTAHDEMKSYVGVAPLNIIQITSNNLANLQTQLNGLDISYVGNFIVQYTDRIVIYDYYNDRLRGTATLQQVQQAQMPDDFFTKLNKHPELKDLQNQQPIGGKLDESSLNTLKKQFPDVYANAKVGDFLLRYQTKLIIYDYSQDKIINDVNLG